MLGALVLGCSWGPARRPLPSSEALHASIESVAVVSIAGVHPSLEGPTSGRGHGAGKGALYGFVALTEEGSHVSDPIGVLAYFVLPPVFVVVGGVAGFVMAEPAELVERVEESLARAYDATAPVERLRRCVEAEIARSTPLVVERDTESQEAESAAEVQLELFVSAIGLDGNGVDPPLAVRLDVTARLRSRADGAVLHELELRWRGGRQRLRAWGEDDAAPFARELRRACAALAAELVSELFLLYLPANGVGT